MRTLRLGATLVALCAIPRPVLALEPLEHLVRKVMEQPWPSGKSPAASGFFVDPSGLVLTNAHAVSGCRKILAGPRGAATPATLLGLDATADMALIRTAKASPAVLSFRRRAAVSGQPIHIESLRYSAGIAHDARLSGETAGAEAAGRVELMRLARLNAPLQDGSSGSPVLDADGGVIGMVVGRLSETANAALAMPSERLTRFLQFQGVTPKSAGVALFSAGSAAAAVAEVRCQ